jgi:hypothetical protein
VELANGRRFSVTVADAQALSYGLIMPLAELLSGVHWEEVRLIIGNTGDQFRAGALY